MIQLSTLFETTDHWYRKNISIGDKVHIVLKKDQKTNKLTVGVVNKILTKSQKHTRGIKVKLNDGKVGRVQKIIKD